MKRRKAIEMALNKIKIKPIDISDALLSYNEDILTKERINFLIPIMPSDKEYDEVSLKTENLESEEDFAECDLFVVLVGCIKYNKERLQAIQFKNNYPEQCKEALKLIQQVLKGFDFVKNDNNFHRFLEISSEQGNPTDDEADKGGSFGFKLSSLPKLYEMKSNIRECNLFQYIIQFIMEKVDKKILSFMANLKLFDKIQITKVKELYNSLKDNFKSIETLKKMLEKEKDDLNEDDRTEEFLQGFYDKANKNIQLVEKNFNSINSKYINISELD